MNKEEAREAFDEACQWVIANHNSANGGYIDLVDYLLAYASLQDFIKAMDVVIGAQVTDLFDAPADLIADYIPDPSKHSYEEIRLKLAEVYGLGTMMRRHLWGTPATNA